MNERFATDVGQEERRETPLPKASLIRCRQGLQTWGTLFSLGSPEVIQAATLHPLDWCLLDWEHGLWHEGNLPSALRMLTPSPMLGLVRVPFLTGPWIKKALDWGADGVLVPNIRHAEDAWQCIQQARYAPLGQRGVGPLLPSKFYTQLHTSVRDGNSHTLLWLMIETVSMIDELEEICRMPGIDGFLVGRNDLAQSLGQSYADSRSQVDALAEKALRICRASGKPAGCFAGGPADLRRWQACGATLLIGGDDAQFIRDGMAGVARGAETDNTVSAVRKEY